MFGSINGVKNKGTLQQIKNYAKEKSIYIWFDEEITFYDEIYRMLNEQKTMGNITFAITSKNQPCNSSDVLFPFDKYDSKVLFSDETRTFFKRCCRENINILFECLDKLIVLCQTSKGEIFVVEGYDNEFEKIECSLKEVKENIIMQIEDKIAVNSITYCIEPKLK